METPFPLFSNEILAAEGEPGRWDELHLYNGNRCNRACAFCCVHGGPEGEERPWTEATLQCAARLVARRGSLKFYGGEPTLNPDNLGWAMKRLRELGFAGTLTIFSNGVRARTLLDLLESDPRAFAVLNYAIATGRGETPLPAASLRLLTRYAATHPGRLFLSHDFLVPVGRQEGRAVRAESAPPARCFHCFPTLTSTGRLHACPFAVEQDREHYRLGDLDTPAPQAMARFRRFQQWIDTTLEPAAAARAENPCAVCAGRYAPAFPAEYPSAHSICTEHLDRRAESC
jgi:hypothetical protein